jgi:hypothetical protein
MSNGKYSDKHHEERGVMALLILTFKKPVQANPPDDRRQIVV